MSDTLELGNPFWRHAAKLVTIPAIIQSLACEPHRWCMCSEGIALIGRNLRISRRGKVYLNGYRIRLPFFQRLRLAKYVKTAMLHSVVETIGRKEEENV